MMDTARPATSSTSWGWYNGTKADWESLPLAEREELAFHATGCEVAWPTWEVPVACLHTKCRIRRGMLPIVQTNEQLLYEAKFGWLRSLDRSTLAKVFVWIRREARKTGIYDIWEIPDAWQVLVYGGIFGGPAR